MLWVFIQNIRCYVVIRKYAICCDIKKYRTISDIFNIFILFYFINISFGSHSTAIAARAASVAVKANIDQTGHTLPSPPSLSDLPSLLTTQTTVLQNQTYRFAGGGEMFLLRIWDLGNAPVPEKKPEKNVSGIGFESLHELNDRSIY